MNTSRSATVPTGLTVPLCRWLAGLPEMPRRVYPSAVKQILACPTYAAIQIEHALGMPAPSASDGERVRGHAKSQWPQGEVDRA
jgi:hypothetical protein